MGISPISRSFWKKLTPAAALPQSALPALQQMPPGCGYVCCTLRAGLTAQMGSGCATVKSTIDGSETSVQPGVPLAGGFVSCAWTTVLLGSPLVARKHLINSVSGLNCCHLAVYCALSAAA